jgi:hypothetical protein
VRERWSAALPFTAFTDIPIAVSIFREAQLVEGEHGAGGDGELTAAVGALELAVPHCVAAANAAMRADRLAEREEGIERRYRRGESRRE